MEMMIDIMVWSCGFATGWILCGCWNNVAIKNGEEFYKRANAAMNAQKHYKDPNITINEAVDGRCYA